MSLQIYNTLTQRKEPFEPLVPGEVRMYACGVTVYDLCHLGHARQALVFDVIRRYLEFKGFRVIYVRNFTDVDDKIINRAKELGLPWDEVARHYIEEYYRDMDGLGIWQATIEPKATEHIPEMIALIETLLDKGYAYEMDGNIFFEVEKFSEYGKLSGRNAEEMLAGARIEIDPRKKDPLDFALWKRSKQEEPAWDSPWGKGRPGWHIECSAMSMKYLGESFDIHGGGADLIFPHHENEIAQSESCTGKPFARYWIHNGFVSINKEKMSKSLGNFFTIREVLQRYTPEAVKLFLLSTHYRSPLDFSDGKLEEAKKALMGFHATFDRIRRLKSTEGPVSGLYLESFEREAEKAREDFEKAMDDDFNTAQAVAALFRMKYHMNVFMDLFPRESAPEEAINALKKAKKRLENLGEVLGLSLHAFSIQAFQPVYIEGSPVVPEGLRDELTMIISRMLPPEYSYGLNQKSPTDMVNLLLDFREEARLRKDWAISDAIRAKLNSLGIEVWDTPQGTRWRWK